MILPARRKRIERFAGGKLQAGDDEMQFMMPGVGMPYPQNIALIRLHPGEGNRLEIIHDLYFLLWRNRILRPPRADARSEFPFAVNAVD